MRNINDNILDVIGMIEKVVQISSDKETNVLIGLKKENLKKLKISNKNLESIFLLLQQNSLIKIKTDLIFDFNGSMKYLDKTVTKKLFGKKGKNNLSEYDNARHSIAFYKECKNVKKYGEIQIIVRSLEKLNSYKKKIEQIDDTVIHWIEFKSDRKIMLDGKKKLTKTNLNSENDIFFQYVYDRANKEIGIEEIEIRAGKLKKKPTNILNDLGFTGEIKKMFFPAVSNKAIVFINPITEKYLKDNKLKKLRLDKK